MHSSKPLPIAPIAYSHDNEDAFRRQIEIEIQDLYAHIEAAYKYIDRDASAALRKYQFLHMGAANG